MGTFSKAYGTIGGHISGSESLAKFAWNKSGAWLLSSSHPPPVVAAMIAAIDVLESKPQHVERPWRTSGSTRGCPRHPSYRLSSGRAARKKRFSDLLYYEGYSWCPLCFLWLLRIWLGSGFR